MHQSKHACGQQEALVLQLSGVVLCMVIAKTMASYSSRNPSIKTMSFLFNAELYIPVVPLAFKHGHNKVLVCSHQEGSRNVLHRPYLAHFPPLLCAELFWILSCLQLENFPSVIFCLLRLHVAKVCSPIPFICLKWFCTWDTECRMQLHHLYQWKV